MGKYSRLGKNTILVFLGNIGSKLIAFIMLPFYTKWLSVDDYGIVDLLTVYSTFLISIITCCIAESIFIFPKGQPKNIQKSYFSSGIIFSIGTFATASIIFYITQRLLIYNNVSGTFVNYTWIIYGIVGATFMQSYVQQFARSIDKVKVYALSGIILTATTMIFSFLLVPQHGVIGYIYALLLSLFITTIYTFIFTKAYSYISVKAISKEKCKEMLQYSVPLIPNSIMWWLIGALNRPIMEHHLGVYFIGLFAVSNKFPSLINMLFNIFYNSWQISVIEEFRNDGYQQFYNKILRIIFLLLILGISIIALCSKFVVEWMIDPRYFDAWKYIPMLTFSTLFSSIASFVGANFSASRESKYFFYSSIWGAGTSIIANLILIPIIGLWGACSVVVLSHFVMAIVRIIYSWKYVKIYNLSLYISSSIMCIIIIMTISLCNNPVLTYSLSAGALLCIIFINRKTIKELQSNAVILLNKVKKSKK